MEGGKDGRIERKAGREERMKEGEKGEKQGGRERGRHGGRESTSLPSQVKLDNNDNNNTYIALSDTNRGPCSTKGT